MTTIRVPRWAADQLRNKAREEGLHEVWEVLLQQPALRLPRSVPARYRHLKPGPEVGPYVVAGISAERLVDALAQVGVQAIGRGGGVLPAEAATWRFRTPEDVDRATETCKEFAVKVRGVLTLLEKPEGAASGGEVEQGPDDAPELTSRRQSRRRRS